MFIVDFDDTIYYTHALKMDTIKNLDKLGITEELYRETYKKTRESSGGKITYKDESHAAILESYGFNYNQVLNALKNTLWREPKKYLFADTISFLNFLKTTGRPLVLLSLGEPFFQEAKVKESGLHDYFDRIFIVDSNKVQVIKELLGAVDEKNVWFVNDKVRETLNIKKEFPNLKIVLKKSESIPKEEYIKSNLPYFKTLTEIQKYVEQSI